MNGQQFEVTDFCHHSAACIRPSLNLYQYQGSLPKYFLEEATFYSFFVVVNLPIHCQYSHSLLGKRGDFVYLYVIVIVQRDIATDFLIVWTLDY